MKIDGLKRNQERNILIIGCGRLGATLASTFSERKLPVTIIDRKRENFRKLDPSFAGISIEGDATVMEVLMEAGVKNMSDVLVVTDNDNTNLFIAQMVKNVFQIEEVMIRIYDPEKQCIIKDSEIKTIFPAVLATEAVEKILNI